jgi:tRNA nucleotidyltransferase (CCA-adding enzyme)
MKRAEEERLWQAGHSALRRLEGRGHQAFLVGGCVRDRAMGRPFHDVDIATSALPEEVMGIFERAIPTGLKHGTVTIIHEGFAMEVTTFRTESAYTDARRPDSVTFVRNIEEDLARRDFTINAMAIGTDGQYVDPFGGLEDLRRQVIRCVGEADRRFGEDALRMLRAIRFASVFGFRMAKSVWRGIRRQGPRLRLVAMERVGSEWDKMMAGPHPERACRMLERSGLLAFVKEPLPSPVLIPGKRGSKGYLLLPLDQIDETDVRWAAWLAGTKASPEEAEVFCRTIRLSVARQTRIRKAVDFARRMEAGQDRDDFMDAVLDLGRQAADDWMKIIADSNLYRVWLREMKVHTIGDLAIRGDELSRALGKPPGPWVGALLRRLLKDAASGRTANTRKALLRAAARAAADDKGYEERRPGD